MLGIVGGGARIVVHEVALERAVDQNRQFARRGGDRFGLANPPPPVADRTRPRRSAPDQGTSPPPGGGLSLDWRTAGSANSPEILFLGASVIHAVAAVDVAAVVVVVAAAGAVRARCGHPHVIAEIGTDMSRWPTEQHVTSRRPRFALQTGRQGAAQSHAPIDTHVLDALATAGFIRSYTDSTPHARRRIRPPRPMAASSRALQTP